MKKELKLLKIITTNRNFTFFLGGVLAFAFSLLFFIFLGGFGFNPTDDGLILAPTRRIIEGQTPYSDFIWIRPILSQIIYIPLVYFGGDYVLLISRLIAYLQYSAYIWLSVWMLREELAPKSSKLIYYCSIIIAFTLTSALYVFYFVYQTLDGVLLLVVGLALLQTGKIHLKYIGYILIGSACLTRQGFIISIPIFLLLFGDWRNWRMIAAALLPGILFVLYLIISGALSDAWLQLTALKSNYEKIYISFFRYELVAGMLIGYMAILAKKSNDIRKRYIAIGMSILLLIWMIIMKAMGDSTLYTIVAFGVVLSLLATKWYIDRIFMRNTAALLVVSWTSSISFASPFPMWMSGVLGVAALLAVIPEGDNSNNVFPMSISNSGYFKSVTNVGQLAISKMIGRIRLEWLVVAMMIVFVAISAEQRLNKIYREKKFTLLTTQLDGKFPGAAGLKSSASMAAVYKDLNDLVELARTSGKKYAILPEIPAYWVAADDINPLVIDSSYHVELGNNNPVLLQRLTRNVISLRKDTFFIVQKFTAELNYYGKPGIAYVKDMGKEFSQSWFGYSFVIVRFIKNNLKLVTENNSFWMYQ